MFAEAPIAAILIKWWPLNSKGSAFDFRFSPKLKLIKQVHCACNRKMGCFFWRFESSQADQHQFKNIYAQVVEWNTLWSKKPAPQGLRVRVSLQAPYMPDRLPTSHGAGSKQSINGGWECLECSLALHVSIRWVRIPYPPPNIILMNYTIH